MRIGDPQSRETGQKVATIISKATPADETDWRNLWAEWQRHMSGDVPPHITGQTWKLVMSEGSGLHALIARDAPGRAIGFANVSMTAFAWTAAPILFLQDFFVTADMRGRGVGRELLKGVYDFGDRLGAGQVFWMVDEKDCRLQAFYARHAVRTPYLRYMRFPWPW